MKAGADMDGGAYGTSLEDVDVSAEGATDSAGSLAFEADGNLDSSAREAVGGALTITITGPNFVPQDPYKIRK